MNTTPGESAEWSGSPPLPKGLVYARWVGLLTGVILIFYGPLTAAAAAPDTSAFVFFRAVYFSAFGLFLIAPIHRIRTNRLWAMAFTGLCLAATAFVFVMIVTIMYDYMAAAERGDRLGVPGKEGTLVFFSLMQVPVSLFLRRPDLLE